MYFQSGTTQEIMERLYMTVSNVVCDSFKIILNDKIDFLHGKMTTVFQPGTHIHQSGTAL